MENDFGNRIKEIRKMRGKTQERVAEDCGVSTSTIARWEAGSLRPNQKNQKLLANALEVKVDEFYVDSELPVPRNVLLAEILDTLEKLDQFVSAAYSPGSAGFGCSDPPKIRITHRIFFFAKTAQIVDFYVSNCRRPAPSGKQAFFCLLSTTD